MAAAKRLQAPFELVVEVAENGQAARSRTSPPAASRRRPTRRSAWMLGAEAVFVGLRHLQVGRSGAPRPRDRRRPRRTGRTRRRCVAGRGVARLGHEGDRGREPAAGSAAPDARMVMKTRRQEAGGGGGESRFSRCRGTSRRTAKALAQIGVETLRGAAPGGARGRGRAHHSGRRVDDALEVLRGRAVGGGHPAIRRKRPPRPRHLRRRDRARARSLEPRAAGPGLDRHRASRATPTAVRSIRSSRRSRRPRSAARCRPSSSARRGSVAIGPGVEVLGTHGGEPVLVRQGNVVAATFHPELTADRRRPPPSLRAARRRGGARDRA